MSAPGAVAARDPLEDLAQKYIGEAKEDRGLHEGWMNDFYRFCLPWRRRIGNTTQINDQDELFGDTAIKAVSDFQGDMQSMYTPIGEAWIGVEPAETLSAADASMVAGQLRGYRDAVFAEIARSNLNEATLEAYADLAAGTCGICIQDLGDLTAPIHCQAVPIPDLLLVRGTYGGLDFKCRELVNFKLRDLAHAYPRAALTPELAGRVTSDPAGTCNVKECWWRLYDKKAVERWQYVLLVDDRKADAGEFEGDGSCSLLAGRWKTDSTTAWGIGPIYTTMATVKTLDQLEYMVLKALAMAIDPAGFYDNDSVINLDNGLGPGDWIPRAVGSKVDILKTEGDFDTTFFSREDLESKIKRALFQDGPVQSGDTPPTLGQWMDQKAEKARRMGAPFGRLTTEWQIAIFQRFAYLLERRGTIPKGVKLKGETIRLKPQSPIVKAAQQQKASLAVQYLQWLIATFGPQQALLLVKVPETASALQDALGDEIVQLNSPADVQALMAKLAAASQPPPPGAGTPGQTQPPTQPQIGT